MMPMSSNTISDTLSPSDYVQHIYDTGEIPDNRPDFDDILGKHVTNLEKWIRGGVNQPLAIIQARIRSVPALAALLSLARDGEEKKEDKRFVAGENGKRLIKLYPIEDIYAFPDPVYIISPIFESVAVSMIYGMSGTGKTFTALNIGLCVAHGLYWMGHRVAQGTVWYVNTEGGRGLKKRLQAWYKEHSDLSLSPHFKVIPWSMDLRANTQDLLNTLESMSVEEKPSLLILDNFSMCTAGINQNKQEEVAPILKVLNDMAQNQEFHVMIIHHTNKDDDVNGTMAFRNHVDHMVELRKEDKNDKHSPIIVRSQKTRDDELFGDIKTELKQITLYINEETFEPVTSCVVVASESPLKSEGLKDTAQNVLDILGNRSLIFSDWQKECIDMLKISKATFERYRVELSKKEYIEKYVPENHKVYHYRKKAEQSKETMQGVGGNSNDL
jgi:AAA domain